MILFRYIINAQRIYTKLLCLRTKCFAFETPNFALLDMRNPLKYMQKSKSEKEYSCSTVERARERERERESRSEKIRVFPRRQYIYSPVDCAIFMFIKHNFKAVQNPQCDQSFWKSECKNQEHVSSIVVYCNLS